MAVDSDSVLSSGKISPPGFRFHPTDEELVLYYLKKKISCKRHRIDVIADVDVYKWDPEDLPEMSKLKTGDRQWFFFSPRDRKYPNGARSNRGTKNGYWKATGKDRVISSGSRNVGLKKTLVFYRGRAPPSGERTDWVMHEYTLDEEELKRCNNVRDYYALYKVYKKSGPGPKNGEQYGAPFREEDWADDDAGVQCLVELENPTKQINETSLEADESSIFPQPLACDSSAFALEECAGGEFPVLTSNDQSFSLPAGFDISQPGNETQLLRYWEETTSEVTCEPVKDRLETEEEDFLKDYLEIDDLIASPRLNTGNTDKPTDDDFVAGFLDEIDGLSEFDLYQDSQPHFFPEAGPVETGQIPTTYFDNPSLYMNDYENVVETNGLLAASAPGVVQQNSDGADSSWFSSALWSFVESIPTNPASASELALVNKAFVRRMSSFGRVGSGYGPGYDASAAVARSSGKFRRRFMCFSLVGVICAVLWMVIR